MHKKSQFHGQNFVNNLKKKIVIKDSFFKLTQIDPQSIKEHINQQTLTMFLQKSDIIGEPVAITFHILIILRKGCFY